MLKGIFFKKYKNKKRRKKKKKIRGKRLTGFKHYTLIKRKIKSLMELK
jgi:hypothetical protein